jgi:CarD family transcriptional regulator
MAFKIGDRVVHPAHGIGHVKKIEARKFGRNEAILFYRVVTDKCTVWVPAETYENYGLRPVTDKKDLRRYRRLLGSKPVHLDPDHRLRHAELAERLKNGTFQDVCKVLRDLNAYSWQKQLNEADTAMFQRVYEALCDEWAIAASISTIEADQEIKDLLRKSKTRHIENFRDQP